MVKGRGMACIVVRISAHNIVERHENLISPSHAWIVFISWWRTLAEHDRAKTVCMGVFGGKTANID